MKVDTINILILKITTNNTEQLKNMVLIKLTKLSGLGDQTIPLA